MTEHEPHDAEITRPQAAGVSERMSTAFSQVLAEPFPIYDVWMDRFYMIKGQLPEEIRNSPGMKWMERGAKISAGFKDLGAGVADFVWDLTMLPLTIGSPKLRHPNYKKQLLYASMPDIVGSFTGNARTDRILLWITGAGQSRLKEDRYEDVGSTSRHSGFHFGADAGGDGGFGDGGFDAGGVSA